jgi:two-component system CheB/CheR fusion protein
VLDTLEPVEREVRISDGSWYLARIRPYRTVDNFIDGVVLTFADVTERVQALAARKARSLAEAIVDTVHEPLLVLEPGLNVISANRAYCARFGTTAEATLGQPLFEIGGGRWNHAVLRQQLQALAASTAGAERRTLALDLPAEAGAVVHLSLRRIAEQDIDTGMVLLAIDPLPAPFTGGPP